MRLGLSSLHQPGGPQSPLAGEDGLWDLGELRHRRQQQREGDELTGSGKQRARKGGRKGWQVKKQPPAADTAGEEAGAAAVQSRRQWSSGAAAGGRGARDGGGRGRSAQRSGGGKPAGGKRGRAAALEEDFEELAELDEEGCSGSQQGQHALLGALDELLGSAALQVPAAGRVGGSGARSRRSSSGGGDWKAHQRAPAGRLVAPRRQQHTWPTRRGTGRTRSWCCVATTTATTCCPMPVGGA